MNDKQKYLDMMQRYFDGETSPEEEKELAIHAASVNDPDFEELRGTLGYLSTGRELKRRKTVRVRLYSMAAACVAVILFIGLSGGRNVGLGTRDGCISYVYGKKIDNCSKIKSSVDESLADFFGEKTKIETNLSEMFKR
ncbi:MAG: hypothetical protein LIR35_05035 [Bacteroidota bacterium]|nr:hypothetical protein [Bacteroidota bacterium]